MVVRLSDIRSGKTSDSTISGSQGGVVRLKDIRSGQSNTSQDDTSGSKVVRLSDIRHQAGVKQVDSFNKAQQQFGHVSADPSQSPVMQQANQFAKDQPAPAPTKGGWNSIVDNPIVHAAQTINKNINAFGDAGANSITFGLNNKLAQHLGEQQSIDNQNSIAGKAGAITGDLIGISKLYKGGAAVTKALLPNAGKLAKLIAPGLVAGAGYQGINEATDAAFDTRNDGNQSIGKRALNVGESAAQFAGGDVALRYAGKGIKALADKTGLSSKISESFDRMFGRTKPIEAVPTTTGPVLGLPEPKSVVMAREAQNRSTSANTDVIHGQGNVPTPEPLGLPRGQYTAPTRMKVNNPTETLNYVMTKIKPEVLQTIEAPARRDLLVQYIQKNTQIPVNEIHNMKMTDLQDLGQNIQQDLHSKMPQIAAQVAAKYGHDLPSLLENQAPNLREQLAKDTQSQVYGVQPPKIGIQKPNFNVQHVADAAMPETKIKGVAGTKAEPVVAPTEANVTRLSDLRQQAQAPKADELKFADTVKISDHTAPELAQKLNEQPQVGARTSDVLNRQEAAKLIEKHGTEGLYSKLLLKTKQFNASETTAAQILAKHFSTLGGEANLSKAIDLVSKTAKGGREMGQAIQALSQWNKLDQTGALMMGERQLNKGVTDINEWKKLSTDQAAPITEAAQRIGQAQDTKSLADQVLHIVTNKADGEALTEAEKATVKQFHDQVKMINEKGKGILSKPKVDKINETIKEVSQVEPKARTRDQVVSFLDAKAEQARKRLANQRNMGFAAQYKGNPAVDYAIIGASHIAKGVVKLSDFTEKMVKDFGESVKPHINEAFNQATNIFRKENGLPTVEQLDRVVNKAVKDERFTPEDAAKFKAWASEIGHYADHNLKVEATQDLQAALKDLGDSTLGQKIATVQTGSMLLNAVTMERNVLGNAAQLIGDKVSKMVTVPIDWGMSKLTGEQRTIVFNQMNQEKFWKNFMIGTKSGYRGVSPNGQLDSYGVHPNVFGKNNPLRYITKLLGASLQGFDHAFYSQAKGEVLATYAEQLGKAQGLSKAEIKAGMKDLIVQLDDRIHELADHAGKYATYQDETMLSKGADMLRRGLNEATTGAIGRKLVENGMNPKYSLEGFGAGDVLVKFAKTPANLVMRGIDYSPIGFIHSMMDLGTFALNRGKFNQHEAVRTLGRAITGTLGFTGMGYILADAGILTGSASMDKDVRSIQEQSGQGAYKVNWSALGRFFRSGFNYDAAAYQKGDHLMDYQWLQPAAISVAMGVNANKAVKAHKAGDTTAGWQMAGKALLGGIQTVLENPMVQGLSSLVDAGSDIIKKQDPTKLINIAKGIPASFVPTLLNEARQSTDNNQRETFDKSLITEIGNMMTNKVPGLSSKLPISYDSLGNAREKLQGGQANTVAQYLTSFFSPAKMTEYQVSPEAKMVLDIMNKSGDATILPRIVDKYFKVSQGKLQKDLKVNLNKEQFSQLQQETGKMVTEKLSQKATYLANPNVALQHKVDVVKKILSDVGKKAKQDIGQQMGYQKNKIKG